jgi:hypothetical protein
MGGQSKIGLWREGDPQWQAKAKRQVCIDLEERGIEMDKVVTVEVIRQTSDKELELLDLGGEFLSKVVGGDGLGSGPHGMVVEESSILSHQAGDCLRA